MPTITLPPGLDPAELKRAVEKKLCEKSLSHFIRAAWHVIEPGATYLHNWHVDFIAYHLEAISNGEEVDGKPYNRLLINIPPGTMKSLILNVFFPAWEWGPRNKPHLRYICAAHKVENLSARDARRMRMLILSDWYQSHWGDRVVLRKDQNEKLNFENMAGGFRIATAITSLTGIRGDRVLIDDPHSVNSANSDAERTDEVTTFLEAIPSRTNDPIKSAIIVLMQRLHEGDISGVIKENPKLGYDHIMLPMRFDPARSAPTALGYEDPRTEPGELLHPERFPEDVVAQLEASLGNYGTAGQLQQMPVPRGGGIIQVGWWQPWDEPKYPPMEYVVASLDTAFTMKQENDFSALTVMGVFKGSSESLVTRFLDQHGTEMRGPANPDGVDGVPQVMLMYAWQKKLPLHELVAEVAATCREHGVDVLLIENKAAGYPVAQELQRIFGYDGFAVRMFDPGVLDKDVRLHAVSHLFAEGIIYAPDKQWSRAVIDQCAAGSRGKHDDLADCVTMTLKHLRDVGALHRMPERLSDLAESLRHRGAPPRPLYDI